MPPEAKRPQPPQPGSTWTCTACPESPTFDRADDTMLHLRNAHGIDPAFVQGTRTPVLHVDGADWYLWEYEIEIGGVKLRQRTVSERR